MQLLGRIPNFDEPIDALEICHENIVKRMDTIAALAGEAERRGYAAIEEGCEIWRELFSFITHNISNHSRDEEEGLFPMLRETLGEQIDALEKDHAWAEETERFLMQEFQEMTGSAEPPSHERATAFARRAAELAAFYRNHIAQENGVIFPAARRALTDDQLRALGELMRKHRRLEIAMPDEPKG